MRLCRGPGSANPAQRALPGGCRLHAISIRAACWVHDCLVCGGGGGGPGPDRTATEGLTDGVSAAGRSCRACASGVRHEPPGVNAPPMMQPPLSDSTGIPRRPSLVGRDAELAALDDQVALVSTGAFRVVLVTGEPGIGKSRLVNELAERQRDSAIVVGSRAFELGMTYSLALWIEAF